MTFAYCAPHLTPRSHRASHCIAGVSSNPARFFRGQGDAADAVLGLWQAVHFAQSGAYGRCKDQSFNGHTEGVLPRKRMQAAGGEAEHAVNAALAEFCDDSSSGSCRSMPRWWCARA